MAKVNIPVRTLKTKKPYRQNLQTTLGFMQFDPIFSREHVPNRKTKVDFNTLCYADPLPVPVFGAVEFHQHCIFVPYRTIWPLWDACITETIATDYLGTSSVPQNVPFITNGELLVVLLTAANGYTTQASSNQYDLKVVGGSQDAYYYWTDKGIHAMSTLRALHYKINLNTMDGSKKSALPLMAAAKAYIDWFYPAAYVGSQMYLRVQKLFSYSRDSYQLNTTEINDLLTVLSKTCYDEDQVTSVWDNPVAPNDLGTFSNTIIPDITNNGQISGTSTNMGVANYKPQNQTPSDGYPTNGTPAVYGSNNGGYSTQSATGMITQYVISALRSLNDFTLIHRLAGIREVDRYLAEYGINLKAEILKRSMKISSNKFIMEFNQVVSYADTSNDGGTPLGGYAGKGAAFNGSSFEFENEEFGQLIIINSIVPQIDYYQGQHREIMHLNAKDFYHPKFDHLGVQAKSAYEVYVPEFEGGPTTGGTSQLNTDLMDKIFGYAPRYCEYNEPASEQGGLFMVNSQKGLLPFYSLWRDLRQLQTSLANLKHSEMYVLGQDSEQYTRIFSSKNKFPFTCFFRFNVENYDTTLPVYDTFDFEEEKGDSNISMEVNGSKLN